jgi:hypothetical protein
LAGVAFGGVGLAGVGVGDFDLGGVGLAGALTVEEVMAGDD